ncbi:MAG: helix-turn-helix transcriptional regulator [Rhodospirillales bacterium]|nr:helix-turn-helix transcriptional regulator [Rhodospirillales bacterium]
MPREIATRADVLAALAEIFREYGYDGASLSRISAATGLGRGSLYHFFPGGKAEMMQAVLAEIDAWFEQRIFAPLREDADPAAAIAAMLDTVAAYFHGGRRVCLPGALGLGDARAPFAQILSGYFTRWTASLAAALARLDHADADALAEEALAAIQGAIVLSRALDRAEPFMRVLRRLGARLAARPALRP